MRDGVEHQRGVLEQHGVARDDVDPRCHHRRGVDEGRYRRWPFHGVRQPDKERNLGALPHRADKQQQGNGRQHAEPRRLGRHRRRRGRDFTKVERAECEEDEEQAEQKSKIADAVDDERLLAGGGSAWLSIPESNQQVRAEPDALPADEQHDEVSGEDEQQHERAEQVHVSEKARVPAAAFVAHVLRRVDVNAEPDAGDDKQHHDGKRVESQRPSDLEESDVPRGRERKLRDPVAEQRVRPPAGRLARTPGLANANTEATSDAAIAVHAMTALTLRLNQRTPSRPITAAPAAGQAGINQSGVIALRAVAAGTGAATI